MNLLFRKLTVITWETNFGGFPDSTEEVTNPMRLDTADTPNGVVDNASPPDEIFTDVDLRSTGPHQNDNPALKKTLSEGTNDWFDDQQSLGGSDTIVPEVLDDENDDMIVENESPSGGKFVLTPPPTFLKNTDTNQMVNYCPSQ